MGHDMIIFVIDTIYEKTGPCTTLSQRVLIEDGKVKSNIYRRSRIDATQKTIFYRSRIKVLKDTRPQNTINQYPTK